MGRLDHHDPESWRFYVYGENDAGEPRTEFPDESEYHAEFPIRLVT